MKDNDLMRSSSSLQGETAHVETRSPDSTIILQEHPVHRRGIRMDTIHAQVDGLECWSVRSQSGFVASVDPKCDYVLLHWVRSGQIAFDGGHGQTVFPADSVFLWNASRLRQVEHRPQLDFSVATIRQDDILRFVRTLTGRDPTGPVEFSPNPPDAASARGLRFVMATLGGAFLDDTPLAGAPLAVAMLKDMVLGALVDLCQNNINRQPLIGSAEPRAVVLALEFMEANLDRPLRVAEIADASEVSLRSLQIAFRKKTGRSLVEHLRTLRLERARLDLSDPACPPFVSQIAYRWGFSHLSDFARYYMEAFGEHPRATLRRHPRS